MPNTVLVIFGVLIFCVGLSSCFNAVSKIGASDATPTVFVFGLILGPIIAIFGLFLPGEKKIDGEIINDSYFKVKIGDDEYEGALIKKDEILLIKAESIHGLGMNVMKSLPDSDKLQVAWKIVNYFSERDKELSLKIEYQGEII